MSETLVIAKKIYSLDKPKEFFTAMVIKEGRISKVGSKEDFISNKANYDNILDFSDQYIIPGFNDSHIHVLGYGTNLRNLNLVGVDKKEFLKRIKERSASAADGWILGRGWDQEHFSPSLYPTKEDLDSVSNGHPILLHRICGHICVVNSKALQIAGVTKATPNPEGGVIDKDPVTGEPTGILRENAVDLVKSVIPKYDSVQKVNFLREAITCLHSTGITSIQTVDENAYSLYNTLHEAGELTIRVYLTPMIKELPELIKIGAKSNQGDDFLRWGRIKLFSDGSLGAETAALIGNYQNSSSNGILMYSDQILYDLITNAHHHGWQLEIHAIGDRSSAQVVNAFEKAKSYTNRSVLTHCQILNESIITKMAKLGIIANIQPIFLNTDLHWAEKRLGKERMKYSYAWKKLLKNNIMCAGGSDAPVEKPDPLLGIHAAVNRQDNSGYPPEGWYREEALTVWEAVQLYTVNSAFAEFQEHQKGKLLKNYFADFIVLSKDIFEIPNEDIRKIKILQTFVNGAQVFKQNNENVE